MIKKEGIFFAILLFCLTFAGLLRGEDRITLAIKIDKAKVIVGEQILLTVNLEWEQFENEEIEISEISPPQSPLLELINSSQVSKSELSSGRAKSKQTLKYFFKAKQKGVDKLSALRIEYIIGPDGEKSFICSEPIEIEVISLREKLMSTFGAMSAVGGGIFATILGAILLLKKRSAKRKSSSLDELDDARHEQEAVDKLKEITRYRLAGDFKKYYGALYSVISDYTEAKYSIEIKNKNEEAMRKLFSEANLPGELLRLLIETMQLCEKVKFAGYEVSPNEEKKIFDNIQRYLGSLISKKKEEKIKLVEEEQKTREVQQ